MQIKKGSLWSKVSTKNPVCQINQNGFSKSNSNPILYIKTNKGFITIIVVYADDMIITNNDDESILQIKSQLEKEFEMTNLGLLRYYLKI